MIWRQDGDPPPTKDDYSVDSDNPNWLAQFNTTNWPTCSEMWHATAHEQADTVVMILCGQGVTYGLGAAAAGPFVPMTWLKLYDPGRQPWWRRA